MAHFATILQPYVDGIYAKTPGADEVSRGMFKSSSVEWQHQSPTLNYSFEVDFTRGKTVNIPNSFEMTFGKSEKPKKSDPKVRVEVDENRLVTALMLSYRQSAPEGSDELQAALELQGIDAYEEGVVFAGGFMRGSDVVHDVRSLEIRFDLQKLTVSLTRELPSITKSREETRTYHYDPESQMFQGTVNEKGQAQLNYLHAPPKSMKNLFRQFYGSCLRRKG